MKKWAIWKTIVVVLASVVLVAGITVLGVYLGGGFKTRVVNPNTISFVVDDDLFNPTTDQYEVTKSFEMTIAGSAENDEELTNTTVTLSLDGEVIDYGQTIGNGVVIVPKTVQLNVPFTVTANRSSLRLPNGKLTQWIDGGISTITAKINELSISRRVAIDTPVYSITSVPVDYNGRVLTTDITSGERFFMQTTFFPEKSAYLFNDQNNTYIEEANRRPRLTFAEPFSSNITYDFDEEMGNRYFITGAISQENSVKVFAFTNADTQIQKYNEAFAEKEGDAKSTYEYLVSYLKDNQVMGKSCDFLFKICKDTVDHYEILSANNADYPFEMIVGEDFTLTMQNSQYADQTLGANIYSTGSDAPSTAMLQNLAVYFEYSDDNGASWQDATGDDGVLTVKQGTLVDGTVAGQPDTRKFYFANTTPPNPNNAYWTINTPAQIERLYKINVVLLVETEGGYDLFENGATPTYPIYLQSVIYKDDPVSWKDSSPINLTLQYSGGETKPTPATYSLSGRTQVPEKNLSKTVRFFANFASSVTNDQIKNILGESIDGQGSHSGQYYFGSRQLQLYALPSDTLRIYDECEFDLYFATIKVDENGKDVVDENGLYEIVQPVETPVHVSAVKSLHQNSVLELETTVDGEQLENAYYIYAGSTDGINFKFSINEDSWQVFKNKLKLGEISFKIFASGVEASDYFVFGEPQTSDDDHTVTYKVTLKSRSEIALENDLRISSATLTDTGNTSLQPWNRDVTEQVYIYVPKPQKDITLTADNFDFTQAVEVSQTLTNEDTQLSITYTQSNSQKSQPITKIDDFLKLFSVTITDQHGRTNIFADDWTFVSDPTGAINIINDKSISFPSAKDDKEAKLYVAFKENGVTNSEIKSQEIKFKITAVGIEKLQYDNTTGTTPGELVDGQSISEINISKYGANSNSQIDLKSLFKLYLAESVEYTNYKIELDASRLYSLSLTPKTLIELFGENGMITLGTSNGDWSPARAVRANLSDSEYASALLEGLLALDVTTIKFNYNFMYGGQTIYFNIVDKQETGAVNIPINFTILSNLQSSPTGELGGDGKELYAAVDQIVPDEQVVNYVGQDEPTKLSELLKKFDGKKIAQSAEGEDMTYRIVDDKSTDIGQTVGEVRTGGKLYFYDFWNEPRREYQILFYFEGVENSFAPYFRLTVQVDRNAQVVSVMDNGNPKSYNYLTNGQQNISEFFKVVRKSDERTEIQNGTDAKIVFRFATNNEYFDITNQQFSKKTGVVPVFGYNQTYFEYDIQVLIGNKGDDESNLTLLDTYKMKFDSGVTYKNIADRLSLGSDESQKATTQDVVNGRGETITYILVTQCTEGWELKNKGETYSYIPYKTLPGGETPQTQYGNSENSSESKFTLHFEVLNGANTGFYGLNEERQFLIIVVRQGNQDLFYMKVPVIISRVGTTFAVYDGQKQAIVGDVTSDNAETLVDRLISENKFASYDGGSTATIIHKVGTDNKALGLYYSADVAYRVEIIRGSEYAYIDTQDSTKLHIRHVVGETTDYKYVVLKMTLTGSRLSQELYYVIRIKPDAEMGETVYPYIAKGAQVENKAEYVNTPHEDIDLGAQFGAETLRPDEKRFNIKKHDGTILTDLHPIYEIKSIISSDADSDDSQVPSSEWSNYASISSGKLIISQTTSRLEITITCSYSDVVCEQVEYKFIVNDPQALRTIKFEKASSETFNVDIPLQTNAEGEYLLNLQRQSASDEYFDIVIKYIHNAMDGESGSEIVDPGELDVQGDGKGFKDLEYNSKANSVTASKEDKGNLGAYTLRIYYKDYLEQDTIGTIYIYSSYGLVGTLKITFACSVSVTNNLASEQQTAGRTIAIADIFSEVKLYKSDDVTKEGKHDESEAPEGETTGYYYSIIEKSATAKVHNGEEKTDNNLVAIDDQNLTLRSSIYDYKVTLTFKIHLQAKYPPRGDDVETYAAIGDFTFTIEFEVKANIKNKDSSDVSNTNIRTITDSTSTTTYAGQKKAIEFDTLFEGGTTYSTVKYSWHATDGGVAIKDKTDWNGNINIETQDIASRTKVIVEITVGLFADEAAADPYQTFKVLYEFYVEKNVEIAVNYPVPNSANPESHEYLQVVFASNEAGVTDAITGDKAQIKDAGEFFLGRKEATEDADAEDDGVAGDESVTQDKNLGIAPFASGTRFAITNNANYENIEITLLDYTNVTVFYKVDAGDLTQLTREDGHNLIYKSTKTTGKDGEVKVTTNLKNIIFIKGDYEDGKFNNNGMQSTAKFQIICNGVPQTYDFKFTDEDLYSIAITKATQASGGTTEKFYVDKLTSSTAIFAQNRLMSYTVALNANFDDKTTYNIVFEKVTVDAQKQTKYEYLVLPVTLNTANKAAGQIVRDLGNGYPGTWTAIAAFKEGEPLAAVGSGILKVDQTKKEPYYTFGTNQTSKFDPSTSTNMLEQLFSEVPALRSRATLRYGGVEVDFDKANAVVTIAKLSEDAVVASEPSAAVDNNHMETFSIEPETLEGGSSDVESFKDGKVEFTITGDPAPATNKFTYTYGFDIDMYVEYALQFDSNGNLPDNEIKKYNTINDPSDSSAANRAKKFSLLQYMGVKHISTGEQYVDTEFIGESFDLKLEIMSSETGGANFAAFSSAKEQAIKSAYEQTFWNETLSNGDRKYNNITTPYNKDKNHTYLTVSGRQGTEENQSVGHNIDYDIQAMGASNNGNFVCLKFTYTVTVKEIPYSKVFYMIVKVMPDYKITYSNRSDITPDADGLIENIGTDIYPVTELASGNNEQYSTISIAGQDTSIVKVSHQFGDEAGSNVSARDFTYTMTVDDLEKSVTYNDATNVKNKMATSLTNASFTASTTDNPKTYTKAMGASNSSIELSGVAKVQFGNQSYRFLAEDAWGYKFAVCFELRNNDENNDPHIVSSRPFYENNEFAIGVKYNQLNVKEGTKTAEDKTPISITTEADTTPTGSISSLTIEKLDAFGFHITSGDAPVKDTSSDYFTWTSDGLSAKTGVGEREPKTNYQYNGDNRYIKAPMFTHLRVIKLAFSYNNQPIKYDGSDDAIVMDLTNSPYQLCTSSEMNIVGGKGMVAGRSVSTHSLTLPSFPSSLYGNSESANIDLAITFGYHPGVYADKELTELGEGATFEEIFELHTTITVMRTIMPRSMPNNIVQDGVPFNPKDYIYVNEQKGNTVISKDFDVYDDTLEVTIPANGSVEFTISASSAENAEDRGKDTDTSFVTKDIILPNTHSTAYVEYRSISGMLGKTLSKNYSFSVAYSAPPEGSAVPSFKYNGNTLTNGTYVKIGDANLTEDKISIENADRLSNNYNRNSSIPQYYLISVRTNPETEETATYTEYAYTQTFDVTGHYATITYDYTGDFKFISNYLKVQPTKTVEGNPQPDGEPYYVIPMESWSQGLWLNKLQKLNSGSVVEQRYESFNRDALLKANKEGYIYLEVTGQSGSGSVSIDENGTITTNQGFKPTDYISVVVKQVVTGNKEKGDRDIDLHAATTHFNSNVKRTSIQFQLDRNASQGDEVDITKLFSPNANEKDMDFTMVQRYMVNGQVCYKDVDVSVPKDVQVFARKQKVNLWQGDFVTSATSGFELTMKSFENKELGKLNFTATGLSVGSNSYTVSAGATLYTLKKGSNDVIESAVEYKIGEDTQKTKTTLTVSVSNMEIYNAVSNPKNFNTYHGSSGWYYQANERDASGNALFVKLGTGDDANNIKVSEEKDATTGKNIVSSNQSVLTKDFTDGITLTSATDKNIQGFTLMEVTVGAKTFYFYKFDTSSKTAYTFLSNFGFKVTQAAGA